MFRYATRGLDRWLGVNFPNTLCRNSASRYSPVAILMEVSIIVDRITLNQKVRNIESQQQGSRLGLLSLRVSEQRPPPVPSTIRKSLRIGLSRLRDHCVSENCSGERQCHFASRCHQRHMMTGQLNDSCAFYGDLRISSTSYHTSWFETTQLLMQLLIEKTKSHPAFWPRNSFCTSSFLGKLSGFLTTGWSEVNTMLWWKTWWEDGPPLYKEI